ncbi:MAG: hypothetical protein K8T10_02120 [Candidatus Eremiobacteraeota bacterium]|nr:hypothetical protein [Candidatus Eremiobacteraeota bacterium]
MNNEPAIKRFFKLHRGESIECAALQLVGFILFVSIQSSLVGVGFCHENRGWKPLLQSIPMN